MRDRLRLERATFDALGADAQVPPEAERRAARGRRGCERAEEALGRVEDRRAAVRGPAFLGADVRRVGGVDGVGAQEPREDPGEDLGPSDGDERHSYDPPDPRPTPDATVESLERLRVLATLPRSERVALVRTAVDGETAAEVARDLGVTAGRVPQRGS